MDFFKFLSVDPKRLNLTDQQYYLCYSRHLLKDSTMSFEKKREQIRMLRYLQGVKQETQGFDRHKVVGDGIRCVAGAWCTKDYSKELITKKGGFCDDCFYSLCSLLRNSKICEFCQTKGDQSVCKDCKETLSSL